MYKYVFILFVLVSLSFANDSLTTVHIMSPMCDVNGVSENYEVDSLLNDGWTIEHTSASDGNGCFMAFFERIVPQSQVNKYKRSLEKTYVVIDGERHFRNDFTDDEIRELKDEERELKDDTCISEEPEPKSPPPMKFIQTERGRVPASTKAVSMFNNVEPEEKVNKKTKTSMK